MNNQNASLLNLFYYLLLLPLRLKLFPFAISVWLGYWASFAKSEFSDTTCILKSVVVGVFTPWLQIRVPSVVKYLPAHGYAMQLCSV